MKYEVALITGASGGLGREFSKQLAEQGTNLILTDISASSLKTLQSELEKKHKIKVETVAADLFSEEGREKIVSYLTRKKIKPDLLVNNAGLGYIGDFATEPESSFLTTIRVNIEGLVHLTRKILPLFLKQGKGRILNLASSASFQPVPYFTIYAASKVFVVYFTEGLSRELIGSGVTVHAVCPGPIRTPFFSKAFPAGFRTPEFIWLTPENVVRTALTGMDKNRTIIVVGLVNKIQKFLASLVPIGFAAWLGSLLFSVGKGRKN
ncbi:SDR family oxidoreductase [Leptospira yasudae]|uniref:SDR family NAD(P)-dependent oxidoreductase n=1 Tax=Leptospira yasudae TaxID=2202201 RepID=UPI001C4F6C3E|nr:SDR family oxidoreductase [Leptospira yasudae]MBW0432861.1 SDR family oxidoreductase [Leptospira yasudae]